MSRQHPPSRKRAAGAFKRALVQYLIGGAANRGEIKRSYEALREAGKPEEAYALIRAAPEALLPERLEEIEAGKLMRQRDLERGERA